MHKETSLPIDKTLYNLSQKRRTYSRNKQVDKQQASHLLSNKICRRSQDLRGFLKLFTKSIQIKFKVLLKEATCTNSIFQTNIWNIQARLWRLQKQAQQLRSSFSTLIRLLCDNLVSNQSNQSKMSTKIDWTWTNFLCLFVWLVNYRTFSDINQLIRRAFLPLAFSIQLFWFSESWGVSKCENILLGRQKWSIFSKRQKKLF